MIKIGLTLIPPSILYSPPVMNEASSEANNVITVGQVGLFF
jgi:hypothetical protein